MVFSCFKNLGVNYLEIISKKLVVRSGLIFLLISTVGGSVYFANQNSQPETQEQAEELVKENSAETYIKNVYIIYLDEIVPIWKDIGNGNTINIDGLQNSITEWQSQLSNPEYDSLNNPILLQIKRLEEYIDVSQKNVSAEQRKILRELSAEFVEGHESVKEGLLQILDEQGAEYWMTDGTIEYQFKND